MRRRTIIIAAVGLVVVIAAGSWFFYNRANPGSSSGVRATATADNADAPGTAGDGSTQRNSAEVSDSGPINLATSGDADAGRDAFAAKCAGCHSAGGDKSSGPSLRGVFGQPAATVDKDFAFSKDMLSSQKTWDPATLDAFLADPDGFIPGSTMLTKDLPHGPPDARARADLITYLASLKQ